MEIEFDRTIPILRIFDVAKADEFYIEYLGFRIDWAAPGPRNDAVGHARDRRYRPIWESDPLLKDD